MECFADSTRGEYSLVCHFFCEIDRFSISCCAAETKENGRLIMSAEDVWNVSLTAPEANILLCAIFSVKKKVFLCAEPAIHSGKDSQLCGEEIFLFSQS